MVKVLPKQALPYIVGERLLATSLLGVILILCLKAVKVCHMESILKKSAELWPNIYAKDVPHKILIIVKV